MLFLPCGICERITDTSFKNTVLVGRVRNEAQLEASLAFRFYHIPASQLKFRLREISHIALYTPASQGHKEGIRWIGRVKKAALVKRSDIKKLPKDSDVLYYLFEIEQWQCLKSPVVYKNNRASPCFYTSPFLIYNSPDTSTLLFNSEDEYLLFCQLKTIILPENRNLMFYCGKRRIWIKYRHICVGASARPEAWFSISSFKRSPLSVFNRIKKILVKK